MWTYTDFSYPLGWTSHSGKSFSEQIKEPVPDSTVKHFVFFRSAEETVALLNGEMETYDISLVHKPTILVLNKTDVSDGEAVSYRFAILLVSISRKRTFSESCSKTPRGRRRFRKNCDPATL